MGVSNSKPHTAQFSNPIPLEVSVDAIERVREATKPKENVVLCDNCNANVSLQPKRLDSSGASMPPASTANINTTVNPTKPTEKQYQRRSIEIEKSQFEKTLDHVNKLFGHPVKWAKDCTSDIQGLEKKVITCYRECGDEPLKCAAIARQYHSFVSNNQLNAIHNNIKDTHIGFEYANAKH